MIEGFDPTQIVACAIRPQGSWIHLITLAGFILSAWAIAPQGEPEPIRARSHR